MSHNASIHILKDYITQLHSMRNHLHSAIGHQINTLDKSLAKISGHTPKATVSEAAKLQQAADKLQSNMLSSLLGGAIRGITGVHMPSLGKLTSGNTGGMSQGQLLTQIAKAIGSASQRNL